MLELRPLPRAGLVLRREHDDWAVLFDPDTGSGFGLDPVGIFLWESMDGRRRVADLLEALRGHFAQVPSQVADEVQGFLRELQERDLIQLL